MDTAGRLTEFIVNHWELSLAFVAISLLLIINEVRERLYGAPQLGPLAATKTMNDQDTQVLDVREESEYKQGHLAGAIHIPLSQLGKRLAELEKYRNNTLVAYCRSGSRSNRAASQLRKQGFTQVFNLAGGIDAWQKVNLPVTKK